MVERSDTAKAELHRDIDLVREALSESMIWVPSEWDNEKPCMVRDAQEAFERIVRSVGHD
jgi:uncharacterized protein (DUF2267 family)